ncbi:hypothetical protein GCM10023149_35680 [Mucilaginibacter gynuensis]|uniref:Outer membrane protein beta-barrel domain-containing protein n=1 Tax=Mucilaginibacter gynuensis TaxID=1302236 RepID=A0ABP8GVK9_9SPHI
MMKFYTRVVILTFLAGFTTLASKAQIGFNYDQYDLGFAINANQVFSDAEKTTTTVSGTVNFTFNATPYTNFAFEFQAGKLKGGDSVKYASGRQFENNYKAVVFRGQLQAGEFIDYSQSQIANFLKNVYVSSGLGMTFNSISKISRTSPQIPGYYSPGENVSKVLFIPLRVGYEFKVFNQYDIPTFKVDLAYQYNLMMGDNLDGYDAGQRNDTMGQIVLGMKFSLGGTTSYRKKVSY